MKQKKSKKSKAARQTVGELIIGKPWQAFVELLPTGVQKLACHAMEAYDKGNDRRMRQYLSQMQGIEGTKEMEVFLLLLYCLHTDREQNDEAIKTLKDLLAVAEEGSGGEDHESLANSILFAPEMVQDIMRLNRTQRIRHYRFMLGPLYLETDKYDEAAALYEKEYPFDPENADAYYHYLEVLNGLDREDDCRRMADEIISLYGSGIHVSGQETKALTASSPVLKASAVMNSYFIKFFLTLDGETLGEAQEAKAASIITDSIGFLGKLPEEIKSHFLFQHIFGDLIVQTSTKTDEEKYRAPFKIILDATKDSHVFDASFDEYGEFTELLPSGYRVLERISCENDLVMNHFVAGMLLDIALHRNDLNDLPKGSAEEYNARLGIACCNWYLCRYQSESDGNRKKALSDFSYMERSYPYLWEQVRADADTFMGDPNEGMETSAEEILRIARGPRNFDEVRQGMEEAYQKTYEKAMQEVIGSEEL